MKWLFPNKQAMYILGLGAFILLWIVLIVPYLQQNRYSQLFSYTVDVVSVDNFFDEEAKSFQGEQLSKTNFSYDVIETKGDVLIIQSIFDVRTQNGEPIVSIDREYGIDMRTGAHVFGFGDKDRHGYLFAPQHLTRGDDFVYWHINYDAPAKMQFVREDTVQGLPVFVYETTYDDYVIDQTNNLTHLPGVPEERGVRLEPHLTLWIEPETGSLITYMDKTRAYYYDQHTGEEIVTWNVFTNTLTDKSLRTQVSLVKQLLFTQVLQMYVFPICVGLWMMYMILQGFFSTRQKKPVEHTNVFAYRVFVSTSIVFLGSIAVMCGWIFGIDMLKSLIPGLVTMKFSTALSFLLSAIIVFFALRIAQERKDISIIIIPAATLTLFLIMGTLLSSAVFGVLSGVEALFVEDRAGAIFTAVPGRPSIGTMFNFLVIGSVGIRALFFYEKKHVFFRMAAHIIMIVSGVALAGFLFNIPLLYYTVPGVSTGMALHTALFFLLLSTAIQNISRMFFATSPDRSL